MPRPDQVLLDEMDLQDLRRVTTPQAMAGVAALTGPDSSSASPSTSNGGNDKNKNSGGGGGGGGRAVRVATIDNYQGEEADVVVASLVRSNAAGSVGFLREPERINVLLSRARQGLLLLGNAHTLRNAKSGEARRHWGVVLDKLQAAGAVVQGLPAVCKRHGTVTVLGTPEEFAAKAPHGGCARPCQHVLRCGHTCPLSCHAYDEEHERVVCEQLVKDMCERRHLITRKWVRGGGTPSALNERCLALSSGAVAAAECVQGANN